MAPFTGHRIEKRGQLPMSVEFVVFRRRLLQDTGGDGRVKKPDKKRLFYRSTVGSSLFFFRLDDQVVESIYLHFLASSMYFDKSSGLTRRLRPILTAFSLPAATSLRTVDIET